MIDVRVHQTLAGSRVTRSRIAVDICPEAMNNLLRHGPISCRISRPRFLVTRSLPTAPSNPTHLIDPLLSTEGWGAWHVFTLREACGAARTQETPWWIWVNVIACLVPFFEAVEEDFVKRPASTFNQCKNWGIWFGKRRKVVKDERKRRSGSSRKCLRLVRFTKVQNWNSQFRTQLLSVLSTEQFPFPLCFASSLRFWPHLFTCTFVVFKLCIIKQSMGALCSLTVVPLNLPPFDFEPKLGSEEKTKTSVAHGLTMVPKHLKCLFAVCCKIILGHWWAGHKEKKLPEQISCIQTRRLRSFCAFFLLLFLFFLSCLIMTDWYPAPAWWRDGGCKLSHGAQGSTVHIPPPQSLHAGSLWQ